jgi:hypothetical protein
MVQGEGIRTFGWRGLILLSLAFFSYGLMIDDLDLGFIPSIAAVVILSSLAGREFRLVETLILTVVLALGTTALFVWGLGLPYPLFWWR